jgi:hypothetical protein
MVIKTRNIPLKTNASGAVLSLVTLMVFLLVIISVAILKIGTNAKIKAVHAASEMSARAAADAGLTKALALMNQKITTEYIWNPDDLPTCPEILLPNCRATYSFDILGDVDGSYQVVSTGKTQLAQKTVSSTLKLKGLFDYAIFADELVDLQMGTTVDTLNKASGDALLQLATNSIEPEALDLKLGVTVDGDVICGPGGDPDIVIASKLGANITGDTFALPQSWDLTMVVVPETLASAPSKGDITGGETITTSGKYDNINIVSANKTVTIEGDVVLYITGDVIIGNSSKIVIVDLDTKQDASLTIYLEGTYTQKNDAHLVNRTKDPHRVRIFGLEGCESIFFLTDSTFYGTIYAPNAELELHNSVEIFGSVVVNKFLQHVAADFHYDASLRDVNINDVGVQFNVERWQE